MAAPMLQKLKYKAGLKSLIYHIPQKFSFPDVEFDQHPLSENYGFVLAFVENKGQVKVLVPKLLKLIASDAVLWMAYPKKTSPIHTDLNRDHGWDDFDRHGYRPVSQVSLDTDWSALRFRPIAQVKSASKTKTQIFEAIIEGGTANGGAWVKIPFNVEEVFGKRGQVKVQATIDNHPYRGSIANMGDGHILIILKEIRTAIGKSVGDKVKITLKQDKAERIVEIPEVLQQLLQKNKKAAQFFNKLSYTNKKEYVNWITSAKRQETQEKRLRETLEKLGNEIKNPFIK